MSTTETQLLTGLDAAVPLHMLQLRDRTPEHLAAIARNAAPTIAIHGDDLLFSGRRCAVTCNALARGLATAALTAWGGITLVGRHWCPLPATGLVAVPAMRARSLCNPAVTIGAAV